LEACYRLAIERNERIGRARDEVDEARADKRIARGAVLPQVTLEDTYNVQNKVRVDAGNGAFFTAENARNEALVRLRQLLFGGLPERNAIRAADHAIQARVDALEDAGRVLYGDLALWFNATLAGEATVRTRESALGVERERLRGVRARQEVGLARKT